MFSFDRVIFQLKTNYNILVIPDLKNKQTDQKKNQNQPTVFPLCRKFGDVSCFTALTHRF